MTTPHDDETWAARVGTRDEAESSRTAAAACNHLWVRRRDGSRCAHCGQLRLGVSLSEAERERLKVWQAPTSI